MFSSHWLFFWAANFYYFDSKRKIEKLFLNTWPIIKKKKKDNNKHIFFGGVETSEIGKKNLLLFFYIIY